MTYRIEDFLNIKVAYASGVSPDGSKVLVSSNLTGTMQLYRTPRTGGGLTQITDEEEPVSGSYLPTEDRILLTMDEGGNERNQIWTIEDDGSNLTKVVYDPEFIHRPGGVTRDGKTLAYACNRRNGVDFDIYVHELANGDEAMVFSDGGWCQPVGFSPDGRFLAVYRMTDLNGDNEMHLIDLVNGERMVVAQHTDPSEVGQPRWMPDSSAFFFSTDVSREFSAIARFNLASKEWSYVIEDDWNLACTIDWTGTRLMVNRNFHGFSEISLYDPSSVQKIADIPLPHQGMAGGSFARDGSFFAYTFTSPVEPGDVWVYDFSTGSHTRLTNSPKGVPSEVFVQPTVESYSSFDGEAIHALVFRPTNGSESPPAIVNVHGGPESQFSPLFSGVLQYFIHRGYAIVAPNVRGSTGYGKRFFHLDDVRKRMDAVKDLGSLNGWLPELGLDQRRAVLMGGSYGGYMTLAGLAFQPDLWAAGVCTVGISSLVTFLENTAAWRRRFREREYGSLEHDREFLVQASPITHVEAMRAPLFLIHGENDPRVPVGEARQIHASLTSRGIPCEMLIYPDEGHGLAKLKNRLDAWPRVADFLDELWRKDPS